MRKTWITAIAGAAMALLAAGAGVAQIALDPNNKWSVEWNARLGTDFPYLARYAPANAALVPTPGHPRIVFMGDSITEGWIDKRPGFFTRGRVDRGISGQTTSQMLLRMMSDVVALRPRAVHIMGGTNDIAGNTGPMTPPMTIDNVRAMTDIAQRQKIAVLIASVPPAASFPWAPKIETRNAIAQVNRGLAQVARQTGARWVDYHRVLDDGTGAMKPGFASDGVHPTEAGYDAMASMIDPILAEVLR